MGIRSTRSQTQSLSGRSWKKLRSREGQRLASGPVASWRHSWEWSTGQRLDSLSSALSTQLLSLGHVRHLPQGMRLLSFSQGSKGRDFLVGKQHGEFR